MSEKVAIKIGGVGHMDKVNYGPITQRQIVQYGRNANLSEILRLSWVSASFIKGHVIHETPTNSHNVLFFCKPPPLQITVHED